MSNLKIQAIEANNRTRIKDIAKKANVSIGTVDRVIHNRGEVSKATREKILKIIEELDYQPNILASALATKKTITFDIIFPASQSEEGYWNKPMTGVRKAFQEIRQYGISISTHQFQQSDPESFKQQTRVILQGNPDGVVLAPFFSRESKEFIQNLKDRNIPYVFIDSNIKECEKLSYIGQDSFQSGKLAAKLMNFSIPVDSTILVLHFARAMDNQNHLIQREKGFYEYFEQTDPEKHKKLITLEIENPSDLSFDRKMLLFFEANPNIRGIFVTNSQVYWIARFLEKYGLRDIRLIGHDLIAENLDFLKKEVVDFLLCQRPEEQGYNAVITLFEHVIMKKPVKTENYTSIDIVTKENVDYYKEFN